MIDVNAVSFEDNLSNNRLSNWRTANEEKSIQFQTEWNNNIQLKRIGNYFLCQFENDNCGIVNETSPYSLRYQHNHYFWLVLFVVVRVCPWTSLH